MRNTLALLVLAAAHLDVAHAGEPRQVAAEQHLTVPLGFEVNVGQFADEVRFVARTEDFSITFRDHDVVLHYANAVPDAEPKGPSPRARTRAVPRVRIGSLPMRFVGANLRSPVAIEDLPGELHYIGKQHQGLRRYAKVVYKEIYPGIDLVFHRARGVLEYDLEVAPGADPSVIALEFPGAPEPRIDSSGDLLVSTPGGGRFRHGAPALREENGTARREVAGRWRRVHGRQVGFHVGAYDKRRRLRIDPTIVFQESVGGRLTPGVGLDAQGNAYVAGSFVGELGPENFIAKFAPDGSFVGQGFFPGDCTGILDIDADAHGRVYIAGATCAGDLPTFNAYQDSLPPNLGFGEVAFLARLGTNLSSVEYGTYFGGAQPGLRGRIDDVALSVVAGADGIAAISGWAESADFPTTASAYQRSNTGFLSPWVAKFDTNAAGAASLLYSSLLGSPQGIGEGKGVALDGSGFLYVTGYIASPAGSVFPTKNGLQSGPPAGQPAFMDDGFLAKFDPNVAGEASLLYSTLLGGIRSESSQDVAVDVAGHAYLTGFTTSVDFPTTPGAVMPQDPDGTQQSVFVAKINPAAAGPASRLWSTYFGSGLGLGAAVDGQGRMYATGYTAGLLPVMNPIPPNQGQLFLASLSPSGGVIYSTRLARGIPNRVDVVVDDVSSIAYVGGYDGGNFLVAVQGEAPAVVTILPSTTKWKPQKDTTTPIEIIFSGPSDLADPTTWPSVTAEIKDPNGAAVPTPNLVFSVSNAAANEYKLTWSGPWLTNTSNPSSYLPRGNYELVVKATQQGGTVVTSSPYANVSLVEVKKIEIVGTAGGAPLDPNPGPGTGTRIFAEAQVAPTQANQNPDALDKVSVVATVEPAIPDPGTQTPVSVYFRALDVDDPSANAGPVDDDSRPCTAAGCDNQGTPQTGTLSNGTNSQEGRVGVPVSTTTAQANATFQTSIRQGDNYRLAASTSDVWLNGLSPVVTNQAGSVTHTSGESLTQGVQISEMLTLWRTLHLEVDALVSQDPVADQAAMDLRGQTFTQVTANRLIVNTGPFFTTDHPNADDWAGANLSMAFHASDWYDVASNTSRQVNVNVTAGQSPLNNNLSHPALMALPDKSWTLRDDEISSLDASKQCGPTSCAADYTLARDLFAKAYIEVEPIIQSGTDAAVPFVLASHRNITSNLGLANQTLSSRTYWATQLASAFDGDTVADFDPKPSGGTFGINLGLTTVGNPINDGRHKLKSTIFFETIRDMYEKPPQGTVGGVPLVLSPEVNKRVTAHEMLHTFGLVHDALIMCSQVNIQNNTAGSQVTDAHVQQLRAAERPVPAAHNNPCP